MFAGDCPAFALTGAFQLNQRYPLYAVECHCCRGMKKDCSMLLMIRNCNNTDVRLDEFEGED